MSLMPCGTVAAYHRHLRRSETPCASCLEATRVYVGTRRAAERARNMPAAPDVIPGETWMPVVEFEGYEVSNLGRLRSHKYYGHPRMLSTVRNRDGYVKVRFWHDNRSYFRYLHAVVAAAFIGPRPDGLEVRHLDDDKMNNAATNLTYGTRFQNIRDAVRNGKQAQAKKTHCPQGHPYSGDNLYVKPQGWRVCRRCQSNRATKRAA